ncbi:MAG: U32 family peptidase [Prevotella sp.]|nr:U32 family peptidase [Prevotella sp.]
MKSLELLAPAKNLECGISAIDHGADAVYIGAPKFGARAAAGNSLEDIEKLCKHAHQFDAKIFVTVNTLLHDDEIPTAVSLIQDLDRIGVDAVLIQDMRLISHLSPLRSALPLCTAKTSHLSLHASTQTDNRTAEKVRMLRDMGFKRVVLARELSINEIRQIHEEVPDVELEVFVHGALCVSYSGICYASEYCFGRSANRGECAQFCRMAFDLKDADGNTIMERKHLLSLKDFAQLNNLEHLADAGAVSFKIEGRLKDVDYVKNVTAAYSEALNALCRKYPDRYRRASMGRCTYTFKPDIHKSFNRDFTTYFANGRQQGLVNLDTPKAVGEQVGTVKEIRRRRDGSIESFNVASTAAFCNGDGLCYYNEKRELIGFRVNRAEGNRLFPLRVGNDLKPGTTLYRNHDQAFITLLSKPSSERKIVVKMTLHISEHELHLTMTDEHNNRYESRLPYEYQQAQKPQEDNIRKQLTKLGGTPYVCNDITIESDVEAPFIPSSVLAELRRKALLCPTDISPKGEKENAITSKNINTPPLGGDWGGAFPLMTCRYCLRHELGYCTKYSASMPWKEPLTISLSDSEKKEEFRMRFNCAKCQMEIIRQ